MSLNRLEPQVSAGEARVVERSLHGLVGVRLVNPPRSAVDALDFLLGPTAGAPVAQPDVTITFAPGPLPRERLRYVGLNDAAYDDDSFYLLDHGARVSSFDFERLGEPCEFVCEPGASILHHLLPVIGLRLLSKGYLMLHASAFAYEGKGVLVTGWQKGGKTETLLAFMAAGAEYLSDEWTILSPADGRMWGVAGTPQVWDWHLRSLPEYWARLRPGERARLRLLRLYQRAYRLVPLGMRGRGAAGRWLDRLSLDGGVARVGQVRSEPGRLFGASFRRGPVPIDVVFLAGVGADTALSPIEPAEVADRMVWSLAYERRDLMASYLRYRFAFPGRRNGLLETAESVEREYLARVLRDRPAYRITHPYPVPLQDLYRACVRAVRDARSMRAGESILSQG